MRIPFPRRRPAKEPAADQCPTTTLRPQTAKIAAEILGRYSLTAIDVGARWGAGGSWWRVEPLMKVVGFDPDRDECARLNDCIADPRTEQYLPFALGSEPGVRRLYVTEQPACSSFFPPRESLIDRYPVLRDIRHTGSTDVQVSTLDDLSSRELFEHVRFIKLDTQGAELEILQGGQQVLEDCCGVEVEVEFAPIYDGQPLFSDVDCFLRERGFHLWRLRNMCHYAEDHSAAAHRTTTSRFGSLVSEIPTGSGRLYWAEAVYLRDYAQLAAENVPAEKLLILASLLSALGDISATHACIRSLLKSDAAATIGAEQWEKLRRHGEALDAANTPGCDRNGQMHSEKWRFKRVA